MCFDTFIRPDAELLGGATTEARIAGKRRATGNRFHLYSEALNMDKSNKVVNGTVKLSSPLELNASTIAAPNATVTAAVMVGVLKFPTNQWRVKMVIKSEEARKTELPR